MIHYLYRHQLRYQPKLAHSMFVDRADQFRRRLKWDVSVNAAGEEQDEYDEINPLYVIIENKTGRHEASMRLLPTVGKTMVNDHFLPVGDTEVISSPYIWECTRFCIAPSANSHAAAKLMAAGAKVMQEFCVREVVGVFDRKMLAVYRMIGAVPRIVGWLPGDRSSIGVGIWSHDISNYERLLHKSGISENDVRAGLSKSDLYASELAHVGQVA